MTETTGGLAAFDFDGTVSRRDTLVPFLALAAGRRRFLDGWRQVGLRAVRGRVDPPRQFQGGAAADRGEAAPQSHDRCRASETYRRLGRPLREVRGHCP